MSDRSSFVCFLPYYLRKPSLLRFGPAARAEAPAPSLTFSATQRPFLEAERPDGVSDVDYVYEIEDCAPLGW